MYKQQQSPGVGGNWHSFLHRASFSLFRNCVSWLQKEPQPVPEAEKKMVSLMKHNICVRVKSEGKMRNNFLDLLQGLKKKSDFSQWKKARTCIEKITRELHCRVTGQKLVSPTRLNYSEEMHYI